jgi:DNA polymerase-4
MAQRPAAQCIEAVRQRFGGDAVEYGAALGLARSVPDEFRELAEKKI